MKRTEPLRSVWVAAGLALIVCVACAGQSTQPGTANQTLIVEQNFAFRSLDPAGADMQTDIVSLKSVYDTLMALNPKDLTKPYPALATSVTVSTDAKTFTFQLRKDVKFASGNPMTSADVVFSLNRLAKSSHVNSAQVMSGLSVSAPDPYTVVVTSATPNPAVPVILTQAQAGILDSQLVNQMEGPEYPGDQATNNYLNSHSAGSGPYELDTVDQTTQIVFKANPRYWGSKPKYSTIILRNVPAATQRLDIQDGQAQLALDVTAQDSASLSSSVNVIAAPSLDNFFLMLNLNPSVSKLSSNADFREAVKYGIDYNGLLALAGRGSVQVSGFIPKGVLGALPGSDDTQRDVARAQAAIARLGVSNPTINLSYATDQAQDGVTLAPIAAKIQSDLKEVGITVNLVAAPFATMAPSVEGGKLAFWLAANPADYPDPADFLPLSPGSPNGYFAGFANWKRGMNPDIDALSDQASSATDPTIRGSAYQALQQAVNAQSVFIWLFQPGRVLVTAKGVNATLNPFNSVDFGSIT